MGYLHIEISSSQSSKRLGEICGDVVASERNADATLLICSDGIGSGIKANIAATLCVSRLQELLRSRFSLREAFSRMVQTLNQARGTDLPYAVFSVARILNDGETTVLTYEMPPPLFLGRHQTTVLKQRTLTLEQALVGESHCFLEPGEGLLLLSDGITQAGLGAGLREGWGIEGVCRYVNEQRVEGIVFQEIPSCVHDRARELWRNVRGDDCTVALASTRYGQVVNILTGPPINREEDPAIVSRFLLMQGQKVVCGATSAHLVARHLGRKISVQQDAHSMIAPPAYHLEGIDLVTEGAVTLNQVYNILEEDPSTYEQDTGVSQLGRMLLEADRVNLLVGQAQNVAGKDIRFRQQGILPRSRIVPLIAEALKARGKLVVVEWV